MLSKNSTIQEIYETVVGRDVFDKILLQLNINRKVLSLPFIKNMSLKTLERSFYKIIGNDLIDALINLVNSEKDQPVESIEPIEQRWFKEAVFYQIYPKSFKDSNGDGIGDINGIISQLDYLKELGIDCLWLSPIYDSPNDDNGYDIRDYKKIAQDMGSMEDLKNLIDELHQRGMKLIMDLVVNHTSDEHQWYQKALQGDRAYQDYYYLVDSEDVPNNWVSFFSGSAWKYEPSLNKWMLHLFSKKQPDLNWNNPVVRQEVSDIVNFYLDMGVDGFRMDVINYISKAEGLPQGNEIIGKLMEFYGIEHYYYGPHLHDYLRELRMDSFEKYDSFSVGETPGVGIQMGRLLTQSQRKELDAVFNFDHLETPGHTRFDEYKYDLNYLKQYYIHYNKCLRNNDWITLFVDNHDNPKMASKINHDSIHYDKLCMLLNGMLLTLRGSVFLYQGQELGTRNQPFQTIDDYKDVESINKYNELICNNHKDPLSVLLAGSRDHGRVCMMWDESENYGFGSKGWFMNLEKNPQAIVSKQMATIDSVYNFTKELIALRKELKTFVYGTVDFVKESKKNYFGYYRKHNDESLYVEMNLSDRYLPKYQNTKEYQLIFSNTKQHRKSLSPYEFNIYRVK
ncbi:MAG: alpha-glucosidase [Erysipelothrix sp.]|nr:alpha-glucosidase [Erysipelothrix sp.]